MHKLRFFNPYAEIRHTENLLPHWQQQSAVYFVTFLLADSVPTHLRAQWEDERAAWLQFHPEPWSADIEQEYHRRFSGAIERWLDAGHGSCVLRRIECARIVNNELRHFDAERLVLISSVVMPNHVHALFAQNPEHPLEDLIRSWKTFTARSINHFLGCSRNLWQRSYFDRLVRDQHHFANCIGYIRRNPAKARLICGEYILYETDFAKQIA
jgi:putative transposase